MQHPIHTLAWQFAQPARSLAAAQKRMHRTLWRAPPEMPAQQMKAAGAPPKPPVRLTRHLPLQQTRWLLLVPKALAALQLRLPPPHEGMLVLPSAQRARQPGTGHQACPHPPDRPLAVAPAAAAACLAVAPASNAPAATAAPVAASVVLPGQHLPGQACREPRPAVHAPPGATVGRAEAAAGYSLPPGRGPVRRVLLPPGMAGPGRLCPGAPPAAALLPRRGLQGALPARRWDP